MALQDEFDRFAVVAGELTQAKAAIKAEIEALGVPVPDAAKLITYDGYVAQIGTTVSYIPTISGVSIVPAGGAVGVMFTASVSAVAGAPAPTLTYQWKLDGAEVSGATSSTYTPMTAGALSVVVTATNTQGTASAESESVTVSLAGIAPIIGSVTTSATTIAEGDALPTITVNMDQPGVPVANITSGWKDIGGTVVTPSAPGVYTAFATAVNASGTVTLDGPALTITEVQDAPAVVGTIPDQTYDENEVATYDASAAFSGTDLVYAITAGGSFASVDSVSGVITYTTSSVLAGETITIQASNTFGPSVSISFTLIVLVTGSVTLASVSLVGTNLVPGAWVQAVPVYSDASGVTGSEAYQWFRDGVAIQDETDQWVDLRLGDDAKSITCRITSPGRGVQTSAAATITDPVYTSGAVAPGGFAAAFAAVPLSGGTTIWLAAGDHGDHDIAGGSVKAFTSPVTIRSADPANPATFGELQIRTGNTNIIVRDVELNYVPGASDPVLQVVGSTIGSQSITWMDVAFNGADSINAALPNNIGFPSGQPMQMVGATTERVAIVDCDFTTWRKIMAMDTLGKRNIKFDGCKFTDNSADIVTTSSTERFFFKNNTVRDFRKNSADGDHPDGVQIVTAGASQASRDYFVRNNIIHGGSGNFFQAIFLSAEPGTTYATSYNLNVTNNLIYTSQFHGITIANCVGGEVSQNTVIWNSAGGLLAPEYYPGINLYSATSGILVTKNVSSTYLTDGANTYLNNYTFTRSDGGVGTQGGDFVDAWGGDKPLSGLQPVPGGNIQAGHYGATYPSVFPGEGGSVTQPFAMDPLPFDRFVFNSLNNTTATITMSGVGTTGDSIQIRGDNASGSTAWSAGAIVDESGDWTATLSVPLSQWGKWYAPAARIGTDNATKLTGPNDFGCGHVIMVTGQSEAEHWINQLSTYSGTNMTVPTGAVDENAVFVLMRDNTIGNIKVVPHTTYTYVNNVTPSKACMWLAKLLSDGAPGRKFCIGDGAVPGTGRIDLFSDSDANDETSNDRSWANYEATADVMTGGSRRSGLNITEIGHMLDAAWFTNDAGILKTDIDRYVPGYIGVDVDGATHATGAVDDGGNTVDHFLWDLSGLGRGLFSTNTKWSITPPNNYDDYLADLQNSLTFDTGLTNSRISFDTIQADWEALHATSRFNSIRGVSGVSPHVYQSGTWTGATWDNQIHPGTDSVYGGPYLAMHMGVTMLKAIGVDYIPPEITGVTVPAGGANAIVRVSLPNGGTLTTGRIKRNLGTPTPNPAHRQPAHGFEILRSGDAIADLTPSGFTATITNTGAGTGADRYGEVTITPSVAFATGDTLHYARGGAYGLLDYQAENASNIHMDFLIESVPGLTQYDGIPVTGRVSDLSATPSAGGGGGSLTVEQSATVLNDTAFLTDPDHTSSAFVVGSAANRALFVVVHGLSAANEVMPTGLAVTYGGVAMTPVVAASPVTDGLNWVAMFRLMSPATGSATFNISWSGQSRACAVTAIELSGVDQTTTVVGSGSVQSAGANVTSLGFTTTDGDICIAGLSTNGGNHLPITSDGTLLQSGETGTNATSDTSFGLSHAVGSHTFTITTAVRAGLVWAKIAEASA